MKFSFNYKKKNFNIDVIECRSISSRFSGLMFRKKSKPLLFIYKKPVQESIHSFFCKPFIAVWFYKDKIIDVKIVDPWKINIKPKDKFDKLLEIPISDSNFHRIIDVKRKV